MRSLRSRLFIVWALSLAAALAVGLLMWQLYTRSSSIERSRATDIVTGACDQIRETYRYYDTDWRPPSPPAADASLRRDLAAILALALEDTDGLRAGIWDEADGLLARYPGDAADFPDSSNWLATAKNAVDNDRLTLDETTSGTELTIVAACPLPGPIAGLTAFVSTRVVTAAGLRQLRLGLGVMLVLVLAIAAWLGWLVVSWSRHVQGIEAALAGHASGALPRLAPTGEREFDRIIGALNAAGLKVAEAQRDAADASARLLVAERLAAVGRLAAGVAHEIRNPIAAMRLRAENALAGPDERRKTALAGILDQITRLDRLLSELLAMTQSREPVREPADLEEFLRDCAAAQAEAAARAGVAIEVEASGRASFDAAMMGRVVGNLLQNAMRETPPGGRITISGTAIDGGSRIVVSDTGPGVSPDIAARLFDPFVTGRADGTGLGLAIARELVTAHGGTIRLEPSHEGARFVIELPAPGAA